MTLLLKYKSCLQGHAMLLYREKLALSAWGSDTKVPSYLEVVSNGLGAPSNALLTSLRSVIRFNKDIYQLLI